MTSLPAATLPAVPHPAAPPSAEPSWVADACTLPTAEQPLRVAEFDQLFRHVRELHRLTPTSVQLSLLAEPEVAAQAAGLAARESRCCGFFTFTLTVRPLELQLTIEVSGDRVDVLDALTTRVEAA